MRSAQIGIVNRHLVRNPQHGSRPPLRWATCRHQSGSVCAQQGSVRRGSEVSLEDMWCCGALLALPSPRSRFLANVVLPHHKSTIIWPAFPGHSFINDEQPIHENPWSRRLRAKLRLSPPPAISSIGLLNRLICGQPSDQFFGASDRRHAMYATYGGDTDGL